MEWKGSSLSFILIWGCEAYVKCLLLYKLTPKSGKCFFVGYPNETRGYYFYNRTEGKMFFLVVVSFLKEISFSKSQVGVILFSKKFEKSNKWM